MKRFKTPKFKHVEGIPAVVRKLRNIEDSIIQRSIELLFYLTAAVHFDFVEKIVNGKVEDMFRLTPNSICYLIDMKWEEVGHNRLFMLTGGYAKSIRILSVATTQQVKQRKTKMVTMAIGITDSEKRGVAELLERGGGVLSQGEDKKTYQMRPRPLWMKYKRYMSAILSANNWGQIESSTWLSIFRKRLNSFASNIKNDVKNAKMRKIDMTTKLLSEKSALEQFVSSNTPKDTMDAEDLLDIALGQRLRFTPGTWEKIVEKFKKYMRDSSKHFPARMEDMLDETIKQKSPAQPRSAQPRPAEEDEYEPFTPFPEEETSFSYPFEVESEMEEDEDELPF